MLTSFFNVDGAMRVRILGVSTDGAKTLLAKGSGELFTGLGLQRIRVPSENLAGYEYALVQIR